MRKKEQSAAEKERLSDEYQTLFQKIAEVCFRHDPMGINFEGNSDEYEPEVRTILPRLKACQNSDDARTVVHEEFQEWFGSDTAGPSSQTRSSHQSTSARAYLQIQVCG